MIGVESVRAMSRLLNACFEALFILLQVRLWVAPSFLQLALELTGAGARKAKGACLPLQELRKLPLVGEL